MTIHPYTQIDELLIAVSEQHRRATAAHETQAIVCPACGASVIAFEQPAMIAGRPSVTLYNCLGVGCPGASSHPLDAWLDAVLPHAGVKASAA